MSIDPDIGIGNEIAIDMCIGNDFAIGVVIDLGGGIGNGIAVGIGSQHLAHLGSSGGIREFLAAFESTWEHLSASGVVCSIWDHPAASDGIWQHLEASGSAWQHLGWQHLAAAGIIRHQLAPGSIWAPHKAIRPLQPKNPEKTYVFMKLSTTICSCCKELSNCKKT